MVSQVADFIAKLCLSMCGLTKRTPKEIKQMQPVSIKVTLNTHSSTARLCADIVQHRLWLALGRSPTLTVVYICVAVAVDILSFT